VRTGGCQTAAVTATSSRLSADAGLGAGSWRTAWTAGRARLWLTAAAAAAWLPVLGVPLRGWLDFSAFFAAGQLAFTPAVTDLVAVTRLQVEQGLPITPFVYPAGLALLYAPLTALPYGLAALLHAALMLALLVLAADMGARLVGLPRRWAVLGTLAWAPAAAGVLSGQNTSLALLLVVIAAWALVRGHEGRAGLAVGLLAYKPQLAAPMLGLLVLRGRVRAVLLAVVVLGVHYLAGVLATGGRIDWPLDWLATVNAYQEADFQANGWQAISLPALGTRLELATGLPALALLGTFASLAIVLACLPALRRLPLPDAVALAAALGLLVSPHAWVYDATLLLPALAVLAARSARRGWPWRDRWWLALAYGIALGWSLGGFVGLTAMPLLVLAMPVALLERGPFRTPTTVPARAPQASPGR
jgi:hypothetical protein